MGSATLKAWFALVFPHLRWRSASAKGLITPSWGPLWELIKKQKATWSESFGSNGDPGTQWELHEPLSLGEFYALAMFTIYRNVLDNPEKDDKCMAGLKWCKDYNEDEEKFLVLHSFLSFLGPHCTGEGVIQFDRPAKSATLQVWKESRGGKMHAAVRQFLTGEQTDRFTFIAHKVLH
jgi:hypothetical protein